MENFEIAYDQLVEEMTAKTVAQQRAKRQTYDILKENNLPIPVDLLAEMRASGLE